MNPLPAQRTAYRSPRQHDSTTVALASTMVSLDHGLRDAASTSLPHGTGYPDNHAVDEPRLRSTKTLGKLTRPAEDEHRVSPR